MKKIAIIQSNYIPWKGYFDMIASVDEFVFLDHVQFTRRDWRNRNFIKTQQGLRWLTIPVAVKGKFSTAISNIKVADHQWPEIHWASIRHAYAKAPYFREYSDIFQELFLEQATRLEYLSEINFLFISAISQILRLKTRFSQSERYRVVEGKTKCLVEICKQAGATTYLSGPAAKSYLDIELFRKENIQVAFANYEGYPHYQQLHGSFDHHVSIVDLIMNTGPNAYRFLKSRRRADADYNHSAFVQVSGQD